MLYFPEGIGDRMNWDFWKGLLIGLFIGAAITLVATGFYLWAVVGAIPVLGGIAQGIIKKRVKKAVGLAKPPRKSFQFRDRD